MQSKELGRREGGMEGDHLSIVASCNLAFMGGVVVGSDIVVWQSSCIPLLATWMISRLD